MHDNLLDVFIRNPDTFLSGEKLSEELGCSRTAVWKRINALKEEGYVFESAPRKGYKLVEVPARINPGLLLSRLRTKTLGQSLKLYETVSSTQDIALELVRSGAPEGTLVVAERQFAGRGRMGRRWHSPKGRGIWMSLILKPDIPLPLTPQLTLLTAVALCRAMRTVAKVPAGIKWPNDILINGRKVSGILLESSAEDERLQHVIAGVGISANLREEDYPPELKPVATSLLLESGSPVEREELIAAFLNEWEELYGVYRREGFSPIRTLWEALSISIGRTFQVQTPQGEQEGTVSGLDPSGALLLISTQTGKEIKIYSGEIGG
ncbi:biotin--[acetyl-CoA-carboxylase] ligase [Paenibacillus sp. CC-CFT747]|nr:biotin--[acetyl-CoA-carboxylase] ligase [Paenibacillus sp. CC-CFT747]